MDDTLHKNIQAILSPLSQDIQLLDQKGQSLIPRGIHSYYLPQSLQTKQAEELNGYLFQLVDEDESLILMTRDGEPSHDLLRLACHAVRALVKLTPPADDMASAYLHLLSEDLSATESETLAQSYGIPHSLVRSVLVLSLPGVRGGLYRTLKDVVPLSDNDQLLEVNRQHAVLIKAMDKDTSPADVEEYALALQDTLREETGLLLTCAIGDPAAASDDLRQSYLQAQRALEIGPAYLPRESVFIWHKMVLPRFLSDITPERAQQYHALLFNKKTASLFSQEMVETVDMFLEKSLNISDTARQLYIHRNTLVYRLDKVQRFSGLDLRHFEDAFVYKLLSLLKKNIKNKAKRSLL